MVSVHGFRGTDIMYIMCDVGHNHSHQIGGFPTEQLNMPCPVCAEIKAAEDKRGAEVLELVAGLTHTITSADQLYLSLSQDYKGRYK